MSDPWLDRLPSQEREKIRKRMRSPEEYERLREKVKGPEDLEREMERNAEFAEARLALESEPKAQERAQNVVRSFAAEQGVEKTIEKGDAKLSEALSKGRFDVIVDHHGAEPRLAVKVGAVDTEAPTGKVQEIYPLRPALQQQILVSLKIK